MILLTRAVVHPWLCDMMGHLTTRHYMGIFDDATYVLFGKATGWMPNDANWAGKGWADVRHEIDYVAELSAGTTVEVHGAVGKIGRTSMEYSLDVRSFPRGEVAARLGGKSVFFDLVARKATPITDAMRARAAADGA
ncbi:MAG: acyl-CoA thioesterase [Rhizobiaceae bacterium]